MRFYLRKKHKTNKHNDWFKTMFVLLDRNSNTTSTSYLRNDGEGKENLHFDDQVNKMIFCFALRYF